MGKEKQELIDWVESFLGALEDGSSIQNGLAAEEIVNITEIFFQGHQSGEPRPLPNPLVLLRALESRERQT